MTITPTNQLKRKPRATARRMTRLVRVSFPNRLPTGRVDFASRRYGREHVRSTVSQVTSRCHRRLRPETREVTTILAGKENTIEN